MDDIIAVHKQVGQALRHLTAIAEQASEGIVIVDLNGALRFANTAWATMHGYKTGRELIGKQISAFHTKEQMKTDIIPFIEETKRRGQLAGPVEHLQNDGTVFPTRMKMITVKDEEGKPVGLIVFVTDITEHRETEQRLRDQTTELTAANEQLQNQNAERKHAEVHLKQQTDELTAENEQLRQQITQLERAEQSLRQQTDKSTVTNEQLQDQVAEHAGEGIVVVDLNGALRFVNAAWATMHGYKTGRELIGKQISAFHTKEQMKTDVIPFIEEAKRRGQLAGPVEHVRRDGTPFSTEMLMVLFKDQADKPTGVVGFATKLTDHERTEDELERYRGRLGQLIKQQSVESKAANGQLQSQIAEHQQVQNELQKYRERLEERLRQQSAELTATNKQLQYEITKREQTEQCLVLLQAKLDNINSIISKYL
jgi:PAS domain S-box-containing protein